MRQRGFKFYLGVTGGVLAIAAATLVVLAQGPDRDVRFEREVIAEAPPEALIKAMGALINWPNWVFSMESAQRVDVTGRPFIMKDQVLETGALIHFYMKPKKGLHRAFELTVVVSDYAPGKWVELHVLKDSSERLTRLFDHLTWRVEIIPAQAGLPTRIKGTETARTRHWRSRLFSRIAERILLNQIFYPDLLTLGKISQPMSPNPRPDWAQ